MITFVLKINKKFLEIGFENAEVERISECKEYSLNVTRY